MRNEVIMIVVAIIVVILFIAIMIKTNHRDILNKIVLSLVVQAEKTLGSKTGELKYAYVVDKLYDRLPGIIKILYTKNDIHNIIESQVTKLNEILKEDTTLSGYDDEIYIKKISE